MSAAVSDGFVDEGPSPLEFTTHYLRLPVSSVLAERGTTVAGREVWEDRRVVVVETPPLKNRQEFKRQFWIDPCEASWSCAELRWFATAMHGRGMCILMLRRLNIRR